MSISVLDTNGALMPNDGTNGISILAPDGSLMSNNGTNGISIIGADGQKLPYTVDHTYSILDANGALAPYIEGKTYSILATDGSLMPYNTDVLFSILGLFANNEQGAWYDPSDLSTLFQDSAGTIPVTAVEQPVGKMNDKSGRGHHLTQATATMRPVLSALVNLIFYTEDLANADWFKSGGTLTTGVADPDGGNTAFTFTATAINAVIENETPMLIDVGIASVYIRRRNGSGNVELWNGSVYEAVTVTSEWSRVSKAHLTPGTEGYVSIRLPTSGDAVDIWHPQFELGSTVTRYQRVNAAMDYDSAGFPHYLKFDGVDDRLNGPVIGTMLSRTNYEVVAAFRALLVTNNATPYQNSAVWMDSDGYMGLHIKNDLGGLALPYQWDAGSVSFNRPYVQNADAVVSQRYDNVNFSASLDNNAAASAPSGDPDSVAAAFIIGANATLAPPINGRVYGIIIHPVFTASQRSSVLKYLGSKQGRTL